MASLVRVALRRQAASSSLMPATARKIHASQPLDPTPEQPPFVPLSGVAGASAPDVAGPSQAAAKPAFLDRAHVHVRLSYLHKDTRGRPRYVPLSSHVFAEEPRRDIIQSSVVWTLDGRRQGTADTKTRGELRFSGKKLRPQKGSGTSRMGSRKSPLFGTAVAHGPKPRDMSSKLNRRVRELATRSVLSLRWRTGDLHVVKSLHWDRPPKSTSKLDQVLGARGWRDMIVLTAPREPMAAPRHALSNVKPSAVDPVYTSEQVDAHATEVKPFMIASKNLPRVHVIELHKLAEQAAEWLKTRPGFTRKQGDTKKPAELHAYDLLQRKKLICDLGALEWLEVKYGGAVLHELDAQALIEAGFGPQLNQTDSNADVPAQPTDSSEAAEPTEEEPGLEAETAEETEARDAEEREDTKIQAEEERVMRDFDESKHKLDKKKVDA